MARRARRNPLLAPFALILLAVSAGFVGIAATHALPSRVKGRAKFELAAVKPTPYSEPRVIRSHGGVLRATFAPHQSHAVVNGRRWGGTETYTGTFPGPTLHVNPGDTVKLRFVNELPQATNLHFHGLSVSPKGISDNVLRTIFPAATSKLVGAGKSVPIVVHIPSDQQQGLYWYHPHFHGLVDEQVYSGLAGMIEVGDVLEQFPWLHRIKQHVMALQAVELGADGNLVPIIKNAGPSTETNLVNGHYQPALRIRPGELQLWRIANMASDNFYKLYLGGQRFYVIGEDGNPVARTWSATRLLLPPGKRFEILVRGPKAGAYKLKSLAFASGPAVFGEVTLLSLVSSGKPAARVRVPRIVSPEESDRIRDVRSEPVARRRQFTFSVNANSTKPAKHFLGFEINGRLYNHHAVGVKVHVGQAEEWLLRNTSTQKHPFHIHTNDFLVEKVDGHRVAIHGFQDTVVIPPVRNGKAGTVLIRIRFSPFQGEAVFHCHLLFHEDHGMMMNIHFGPPAT
jgi:suppressor of ftsI